MAVLRCICKNCGSLITFDDSSESCECFFCHSVFTREELEAMLEGAESTGMSTGVSNYGSENDARILEEHDADEPKENVVAGIVGAMIFALAGGVLWFILYQIGFFSALSGVVGTVCANIGYRLFARKESLKGTIISVVAAVIAILISWYMCLSFDCYNAFKEWFANGEINYTLTFAQSVRIAYRFLAEPEIASPYFRDLAIGLILCAVGAFRFVSNGIKSHKKEHA